jgi:hypothetical protein
MVTSIALRPPIPTAVQLTPPGQPTKIALATNDFQGFVQNLVNNDAMPDAFVYTNKLGNNADGSRSFTLLGANGNLTVFTAQGQKKGAPVGLLAGAQPYPVMTRTVTPSGHSTTEDGLGISFANADKSATFFLNVRGTTIPGPNDPKGMSVNLGFYGKPEAFRAVANRMAASPNERLRLFGQALQKGFDVSAATGSEVGLAWRGVFAGVDKDGKPLITLSGMKVPIGIEELKEGFTSGPPLNRGSHEVARANNFEAYVNGENAFVQADTTRKFDPNKEGDPNYKGEFVDHGDPVSKIAGRIQRVSEILDEDGRTGGRGRVNSNLEAGHVMEIALGKSLEQPSVRGQPQESGGVTPAQLARPEDRKFVNDTAKLIQQYGLIGLMLPKQDADEKKPFLSSLKNSGVVDPNAPDGQFVRDVFQGNFRPMDTTPPNVKFAWSAIALATALPSVRLVGRLLEIAQSLDAGPTANIEGIRRKNDAADNTLVKSLDARYGKTAGGGVLEALKLDVSDLPANEQAAYRRGAGVTLAETMRASVPGDDPPTGQQLINAFDKLAKERPDDLKEIAARINAMLRHRQ